MTDTPPAEADEGAVSTEGVTESKPNWRRELEARATAGDEAVARVAELERQIVFRDAGLNVADGLGKYFMDGYSGDMTVEAIQAEAVRVGLDAAGGAAPAVQAGVDRQVLSNVIGAEELVAEAAADAGPSADPSFLEQIRATTSEAELRALWEGHGGTFNAAQ